MRRTVRSMRLLGVDEPVFDELFAASKDAMKSAYPVLEQDWAQLRTAANAEEETFRRTLDAGSTILDLALADTKKSGSETLKAPRRSCSTTPTASRSISPSRSPRRPA